jgi:peptidoglycan/LPS O-acetylase OafA/YrhL
MVATYHWTLEISPEYSEKILGIPLIGSLIREGGLGVDIFFIISGFVIVGTAQRYRSRDFIVARFIRLFPGLLISMLIVLAVGSRFILAYQEPIPSLINSVFLTYTVTGVDPLATQLWSLLVEIKFYIGISLFLLFLPKLMVSKFGLLIILLLWQFSILLLESLNGPRAVDLLTHLNLGGYSKLFGLGAVMYVLRNSNLESKLLKLFAGILFVNYCYEIVFESSYSKLGIWVLLISSSIIALGGKLVRLNWKVFEILGLSSYIMYLIHLHVGGAVLNLVRERINDEIYIIFILTTLAVSLLSVVISLYLEKPLQNFLRRQYTRFPSHQQSNNAHEKES